MSLTVDCKNLKGSIDIPYSKSLVHRYLFACFLSGEYEIIKNFSDMTNEGYRTFGADKLNTEQNGYQIPDDIKATLDCLLELSQRKTDAVLRCSESGTTFRFVLALVAALGTRAEIIISGSLVNRPIQEFIDELNKHGANIILKETNSDETVYQVSGKLKSGEYNLPGNISSQFISALLLTLPILDGDSEIKIHDKVESFPYINLTLNTLENFNIDYEHTEENNFIIRGNQKYLYSEDCKYILEGDWSAASIWYVANKILGNTLTINGVDESSEQADVMIVDLLDIVDDLEVFVSINDCPDLAPAITLWALSRNAKTTITDTERLKLKESNRQKSIVGLVKSIGFNIKIIDNNIVIVNKSSISKTNSFISTNKSPISNNKISQINCSSKDHRIIILASFLSLFTEDAVNIEYPEYVNKSYPNFFEEIERLGGKVSWN